MNQVDGGSSESELLSELRAQFEREIDLRKSLDSTSANLTTTSIAIVTILIGLGTFLISKIEPKESIFYWSLVILGIGVALASTTIIYLVKSRTGSYRVPISSHVFFEGREFKEEIAKMYMKAEKVEFVELMIKEYLMCIKNYNEIDEIRNNTIVNGQRFLFPAILSIVTLVATILITYGLGLITLKF